MANASDYLEQEIYNHIFRDATFSKPTTLAIGLTSGPPSDSAFNELPNANSYARVTNASGDSRWDAYSGNGPGSNSVQFEFAKATGDWGWCSGVIFTDDGSYGGGNVLIHGTLTTPREIKNGDVFRFDIGEIDITIL